MALDSVQADVPASAAAAGDRAHGAGDIDLGEAGKLVRLVDGAEQVRAPRINAARIAAANAAAADARGALLASEPAPNGTAAGVSIRAEGFNSGDTGAGRPVREGGDTYADPNAGRGVIDQATPEQRNALRGLIVKIREAVESPLAWVAIAVLAIATLAISAAGRRHK